MMSVNGRATSTAASRTQRPKNHASVTARPRACTKPRARDLRRNESVAVERVLVERVEAVSVIDHELIVDNPHLDDTEVVPTLSPVPNHGPIPSRAPSA
jgi:hypothetical protein